MPMRRAPTLRARPRRMGRHLFVTMTIDNGFAAKAKDAAVVVHREIAARAAGHGADGRARRCSPPGTSAADQLVVVTSTQCRT